MKAPDFRKFYLTFTELYGAIYSDDAYEIMKRFYPKLLKKDMYADMKTRVGKWTRGYCVVPTANGKYVVCSEYMDNNDLDDLFRVQADKDHYVCDSLEGYWKIGTEGVPVPKEKKKLDRFLKQHSTEQIKATLCSDNLYHHLKISVDTDAGINYAFRTLERFGIILEDEKDMQTFFDLYADLSKNTRMYYNCGHTPIEIRKSSPAYDPSRTLLVIGENMKKMFINGEMDPEEYLETIKANKQIPLLMKDDLIRQLKEIIKTKKNLKRC